MEEVFKGNEKKQKQPARKLKIKEEAKKRKSKDWKRG